MPGARPASAPWSATATCSSIRRTARSATPWSSTTPPATAASSPRRSTARNVHAARAEHRLRARGIFPAHLIGPRQGTHRVLAALRRRVQRERVVDARLLQCRFDPRLLLGGAGIGDGGAGHAAKNTDIQFNLSHDRNAHAAVGRNEADRNAAAARIQREGPYL